MGLQPQPAMALWQRPGPQVWLGFPLPEELLQQLSLPQVKIETLCYTSFRS